MTEIRVPFSSKTDFPEYFSIIETKKFTDYDLLDIYYTRIQELSDHFNKHILSAFISRFAYDIRQFNIVIDDNNHPLCASILKARDTEDVTPFHIGNNDFDCIMDHDLKKFGSFSDFLNLKFDQKTFDSVASISQYLDAINSTPYFSVNMFAMRRNMRHHLNDVAGHEFAHAITYFYHELIQMLFMRELGKPAPKVKLHGVEWRFMTAMCGADVSVKHDAKPFIVDDYIALENCYAREECVDSNPMVLPSNKKLHVCKNKHVHVVSKIVHNRIMKGMEHECKHCGATIAPFSGNIADYA